ncbi:MAG: M48 family metalloprotease [Planctomycetes bacterium]|nr:M48 family metalloprotease [Planctomycetota bacterium]
MGYLIPILLALVSLALPELGVTSGWRSIEPLPVLVLAPYLLGRLQRSAALRGRFARANRLARLGAQWPLVAQLLAVCVCGWLTSLERWTGASLSLFTWPHPALALGLAPFVLATLATIDVEARLQSAEARLRWRLRSFQTRMFASGLAPLLTYLLIAALLGRDENRRVQVEEVELYGAAFSAALLVVFMYLLPFLLAHTWSTERLPASGERELFDALARRAGFRCKELLVWHTGGLMANAAIVGVTPGSRRVFLSDALLARLDPRELAAVFAHEVGHARQHHIPLFMAWAVAAFGALDLAVNALELEQGTLGLTVLAAGLVVWLIGFGWLSRRVELEADLFSHELLGDGHALASALARVGHGRAHKHGWRHFSMDRRIEFLAHAAVDPRVGARLRRTLRVARWLGYGLCALVLALEARAMVATWPLDLARADLRLGATRARSSASPSCRGARDLHALAELAHAGLGRDYADRASAAAACLEAVRSRRRCTAEAWRLLAGCGRAGRARHGALGARRGA